MITDPLLARLSHSIHTISELATDSLFCRQNNRRTDRYTVNTGWRVDRQVERQTGRKTDSWAGRQDRQVGRQTGRQTDSWAGGQTGRQDRQVDRQTGRQTDSWAGGQTGRQDRQVDRQTGSQTDSWAGGRTGRQDRQVGRQTDGWTIKQTGCGTGFVHVRIIANRKTTPVSLDSSTYLRCFTFIVVYVFHILLYDFTKIHIQIIIFTIMQIKNSFYFRQSHLWTTHTTDELFAS